ncbi:hypothetical protein BpHYR1_016155 [Brachionus plicatilis]|uniref:Uncharacterized protein n=1 Tax=Brachionus plicatilis TaxID=10195 RepID=A0A3M7RPF0_BRAPC|nr:hypothetical protein BpHYR1_016155 [Brachionus plicatilis]
MRFMGTFNYCQKLGHKLAECRKRLAETRMTQNASGNRMPTDMNNNKYQSKSSNSNRNTGYAQKPQAYSIEATENASDSEMEARTFYCESLSCRSVKKANLTRVDVNVDGVTASFININKLCPKIADKISKFVNGQNAKNEFGLNESI